MNEFCVISQTFASVKLFTFPTYWPISCCQQFASQFPTFSRPKQIEL